MMEIEAESLSHRYFPFIFHCGSGVLAAIRTSKWQIIFRQEPVKT
jgi:hypothetical protein